MIYLPEYFFRFKIFILILLSSTISLMAGPLDKQEIDAIITKVKETPKAKAIKGEEYILDTTFGKITIQLYTEEAPLHCANFKRLVMANFYDNTQFHRIIKGYIIQGGDLLTRDRDPANDGTGGPGYSIKNEFNNIKHKKGILSMARSRQQDSAGSQFFIVLKDAPSLDGKYTVFGKVIKGMKVLDRIASVPVTYSSFNERSRPIMPVIMKTVIFVSPEAKLIGQKVKTKVLNKDGSKDGKKESGKIKEKPGIKTEKNGTKEIIKKKGKTESKTKEKKKKESKTKGKK